MTEHPPWHPHRLWLLLHEPRVITATQSVVWMIWAAIGVAAVLAPPMTIAHEIGPTLTGVWGGMMCLGGILGLIGCVPGWWWVERAGIIGAAAGATTYVFVVLNLHATTPGNRLVQAGFILLAIASLIVRWLRISGLQTDPTRGMRGAHD